MARSCPECGLPLVSSGAGAEVLSDTEKSDWLNAGESHDGAARNSGVERGIKHPLILALVVLVMIAIVWSLLFRGSTTEVEEPTDNLGLGVLSTNTTGTSTVDVRVHDLLRVEISTIDPARSLAQPGVLFVPKSVHGQ